MIGCGKMECDCDLPKEEYRGFTIRVRICPPAGEPPLWFLDGQTPAGAPLFFLGPYLRVESAKAAIDEHLAKT